MNRNGRRLPPATEGPLLEWLFTVLKPMSRTSVRQLLKFGQIAVNGVSTTQFDYPLRTGDLVTVGPPAHETLTGLLQQAGMPLVYADDDLLIVNKPAGLLTVASEREKMQTAFVLLNTCLQRLKQGRASVVHRLDRGTSGLLLFARRDDIRQRLQTSWDQVQKTYFAVVEGTPREVQGTIRNCLVEEASMRVRVGEAGQTNAKLAVTHYRVVQASSAYSLLEVQIETGRKHQVRVHLAGLGCPIIGDDTYHAQSDPLGRMGLHASRLALPHPVTGQTLEVESPCPAEFLKVTRA